MLMDNDAIEGMILAECSGSPKKFRDLIAKCGGYHGPNYRPLDRMLQKLRRRGSIKLSRAGWVRVPTELL